MSKLNLASGCVRLLVLMLGVLIVVGCARSLRSTIVVPEVGGNIGAGRGYLAQSQIDDQLYDGGWVMNTPGQPHTHRVVLRECPEQPVVVTHVHNHLQAQQLGKGPHKHRGCYICPPKNSLVGRVLGY